MIYKFLCHCLGAGGTEKDSLHIPMKEFFQFLFSFSLKIIWTIEDACKPTQNASFLWYWGLRVLDFHSPSLVMMDALFLLPSPRDSHYCQRRGLTWLVSYPIMITIPKHTWHRKAGQQQSQKSPVFQCTI